MAKLSTGLRKYLADTGSLKAALAASEIRIYSGTVPAHADDSIGSAVLLNTIRAAAAATLNMDATGPGGVLPKAPAEVWASNNVASGTASFYRHVLPADSGALSTTAVRMQGTCGVGGDMNMGNTALVNGVSQPVDYYFLTIPEGT